MNMFRLLITMYCVTVSYVGPFNLFGHFITFTCIPIQCVMQQTFYTMNKFVIQDDNMYSMHQNFEPGEPNITVVFNDLIFQTN